MSNREYVLFTDSNCDLPLEYVQSKGIRILDLHFILDEVDYAGYDPRITPAEFYAKMRAGSMPITQQVDPEQAIMAFEACIKEGKDILCLSFSSGLSGSYNSARLAAEELAPKYPEAKIVVIDTLCASLGEGLMVYKAVQRKEKGETLEDVAAWVEQRKLFVGHYVIADDLNHLHRGGRVSKATAVIGTALGMKPLILVNDEGKLVPYDKARGRKAALTKTVDVIQQLTQGVPAEQNETFAISHGDCEEDAKTLADMLKKRVGFKHCIIHYIGPSVGAHSGPGTLAVFFEGKARQL